MQKSFKNYALLFLSVLKLSAFTFGGGFVIVTLMKAQYVERRGWLTEREMLDFISLSQTCPGAIAVNAAALVGWQLLGFLGAMVAVLGAVLPPLVLLTTLSYCYDVFIEWTVMRYLLLGMQGAVLAILFSVVLDMLESLKSRRFLVKILLVLATFVAVGIFRVHPAIVIVCGGVIGYFLVGKEPKKDA